MADRSFNRNLMSLHIDMVFINFNVTIGATGAVSSFRGAGVSSITRSATGKYDVVLQDKYALMLYESASLVSETFSGIGSVELVNADYQTRVAAGTALQFQCYNNSGAATDPADLSVLQGILILRRSGQTLGGE
jgi:hypothetical protein